ncbi:glycosyltransferase family 2 protein [Bradyrhizobium guangdongense]|uniref:glycosyltransferase family 2 protein n=1 Tax=Bradyrhizobium guangdongense TaxID=1325090 RepID=UPI00131A209D
MPAVGSRSQPDPLVTIAIPTFNRSRLLKGCLESALAQSYANIEVLVSDNASTDDTGRVLETFADPRLRVVRQQRNIGLLPNWNACLAAAQGEYIVFLSDDDRIAPNFLDRCLTLRRYDPQLPIVVSICDLHSGELLPGRRSDRMHTGVWEGVQILLEFLREQITVTICGIVMRTELLRAQGGFPIDMPFAADVAAWVPLLFHGRAGLVNDACATYSIHGARETSRLKIDQLLTDCWKSTAIIAELADRSINESKLRHRIQLQARRCFARRGLIILGAFRGNGGTSKDVLRLIWNHRAQFARVELIELFRLRRQLLIMVVPLSITGQLRRLKQVLSSSPASS